LLFASSKVAGPSREILAGWIGLFSHRITACVRQVVGYSAHHDTDKFAVLCVGFLRYGCDQAVALSQAGVNVTLYYVNRRAEFAASPEDRLFFLDEVRAAGVEVVEVPRRRILRLPSDTLWLHRDLRRRRIGMAIVQSHIDPRYATLGLALPVALVLHDPQPHSGDMESRVPLPVRAISRFSEITSWCLILHSAELLTQLRPSLRQLPIAVVPHGADMAPAPAPVPKIRRLLIFGRLFPYKGVDTALEAFRLISEQVSDVKLIIAGRGPLADIAKGQRNVEVRDEYIPESAVGPLLAGSRLVLLPYKDATQSGVGLQAVAQGIPCIVSSVGGLPELMQTVSPTFVVPPDNPERLAEAILEHIDHDISLRTAVYEYAATHFAWEIVTLHLRDELKRLGYGS
jgi:glycosyltransferase involved in cell wall biosynthesis